MYFNVITVGDLVALGTCLNSYQDQKLIMAPGM